MIAAVDCDCRVLFAAGDVVCDFVGELKAIKRDPLSGRGTGEAVLGLPSFSFSPPNPLLTNTEELSFLSNTFSFPPPCSTVC
mmetsp:Transcript_32576/g.50948  ORF Transcript_32576/g.50948 Transcript_32576/m.50948 type:complete len:82 (-) Transcript_32576:96-341(-)